MSFTLRGRLETRLAAALLPFIAACVLAGALQEWWPLQLAGVMTGAALALDLVYHPLLPYQPGWLALPLGAVELGATMGIVRVLGVEAPLWPALAFFGASWLVAQALVHAVFPLLHLPYGDDGGELGRGGIALSLVAPGTALAVLGLAWATQPPLVRLEAGVHQGPIVIDQSQRLVGEAGTIVRGGIVITADEVTVRDLEVEGGEYGIEVDGAEDVRIERVIVSGATLDGIHVRRSVVEIRDCEVRSLPNAYVQGIDISFGFDLEPSLVQGCIVTGGLEGIVTHFARVRIADNRVRATELRAITMTEMSMGEIEDNNVAGAAGIGIFCGDYSECEIDGNAISNVRPDESSTDPSRDGVAIAAHFGATARLGENAITSSPGGTGAFVGATLEHE